jgi:antitoxin VapB
MTRRKTAKKKVRTLYVKNPAAHHLAEQVSKQMGLTLSDAVISALEDKLKTTRRSLNRVRVDVITTALDALPVVDSRSPEEILGYYEIGIPR